MDEEPKNITDVLEQVETKIDAKYLFLGEILDTFQHQGYGPLLLTIALLIVLPTGGIPGLPTILGVGIVLISIQLALGRSSPWLPKRLRKLHIKKSAFDKGADAIKPVTQKIDFFVRPRFEWLTSGLSARVVGITCVTVAVFLPFTEVIPFSDILPGFSIALLGLGLTARDGVVTIIGLMCAGTGVGLINYWLFV